jgi:Cohesin domain
MLTRYRLSLVLPALLAIGLLIFSIGRIYAATTTFQVESAEGKPGGTVDVPVQAIGAPDLGALQTELVYDAKVLTPVDVSRGSLAGNDVLMDWNIKPEGRLIFGLATLNAIKGDGPIAILHFKVIGGAGSSSALTPENSKAWESGSHAEVLVKTVAGTVTVVGGGLSWLLLLLIALIVLVLILVFLFLLRRNRRKTSAA